MTDPELVQAIKDLALAVNRLAAASRDRQIGSGGGYYGLPGGGARGGGVGDDGAGGGRGGGRG